MEHWDPTTDASAAFSLGTNIRPMEWALAYAATGSTPRTGRTRPSNASSPRKTVPASFSGGNNPAADKIPTAMGTSKAAPSFFRSAGARFTVIRRSGNLNPQFSMAPRIRTRPSFTPASGSPTMWQPGKPLATSTSTWMGAASMPMTVAERTWASTVPS